MITPLMPETVQFDGYGEAVAATAAEMFISSPQVGGGAGPVSISRSQLPMLPPFAARSS